MYLFFLPDHRLVRRSPYHVSNIGMCAPTETLVIMLRHARLAGRPRARNLFAAAPFMAWVSSCESNERRPGEVDKERLARACVALSDELASSVDELVAVDVEVPSDPSSVKARLEKIWTVEGSETYWELPDGHGLYDP